MRRSDRFLIKKKLKFFSGKNSTRCDAIHFRVQDEVRVGSGEGGREGAFTAVNLARMFYCVKGGKVKSPRSGSCGTGPRGGG